MKTYTQKTVVTEVVTDTLCDICGISLPIGGSASVYLGYTESTADGDIVEYDYDMCVPCMKALILPLIVTPPSVHTY